MIVECVSPDDHRLDHLRRISVDTKKKELIGNFKNGGTDYRPKGDPLDVNVHDFKDKLGKVGAAAVLLPLRGSHGRKAFRSDGSIRILIGPSVI
jgi:hypothetical protein